MTDRLKEIKVRWGIKSFGMVKSEWVHRYSPLASTDMAWLIFEMGQLRKENKRYKKSLQTIEKYSKQDSIKWEAGQALTGVEIKNIRSVIVDKGGQVK